MERVYNQVKRIIDNLNLDKIYKGFVKTKFVLKINNKYYCSDNILLNEAFLSNKLHVIYEVKSHEIIIKDIVIGVILAMYDLQYHNNTCNEERLQYLLKKKDGTYYTLKYQLNLIMINILKGNTKLLNDCISLMNERRKDLFVLKIEEEIEKNIGLKKYIELKLLEILKPEEFKYELRFIIDVLEDPCNLLNYINNASKFSAVYLLVSNIIERIKPTNQLIELDKPLFSFDKLIIQKDKQTKKFLMHKMINAKKTYLKGKVLNIDFNNVNSCDNLLYLPGEITVIYNNKKINKKGEFILQLNEQLEIVEGYECFSIEKILA